MNMLTASGLADWLQDETRPAPFLLDVREVYEFATGSIPGSVNIPLALLPLRLDELPQDQEIITICHLGMRSYQAGMLLGQQGFGHIHNLAGGMNAWAALAG